MIAIPRVRPFGASARNDTGCIEHSTAIALWLPTSAHFKATRLNARTARGFRTSSFADSSAVRAVATREVDRAIKAARSQRTPQARMRAAHRVVQGSRRVLRALGAA